MVNQIVNTEIKFVWNGETGQWSAVDSRSRYSMTDDKVIAEAPTLHAVMKDVQDWVGFTTNKTIIEREEQEERQRKDRLKDISAHQKRLTRSRNELRGYFDGTYNGTGKYGNKIDAFIHAERFISDFVTGSTRDWHRYDTLPGNEGIQACIVGTWGKSDDVKMAAYTKALDLIQAQLEEKKEKFAA